MLDTESPLRTNSYAQCSAPQQCGTFAGQTHPPANSLSVRNLSSPWKFATTKRYTPQNSLPFVVRYITKLEGFKVYMESNNILQTADNADNSRLTLLHKGNIAILIINSSFTLFQIGVKSMERLKFPQ